MRGRLVVLQRDNVIFQSVIDTGVWALEEARFLALPVIPNYVVLDLGANVGLVTQEVLSITGEDGRVVLVEPLRSNCQAITYNVRSDQYKVLNVALGVEDSTANFYVRDSNRGNASLLEGCMARPDYVEVEVEVCHPRILDTEPLLSANDPILLKCDLEGFDAQVLARLSSTIWNRVARACIEVWAHDDVNFRDLEAVCEILRSDFAMSWDVNGLQPVNSIDLNKFWCGKSQEIRELFVTRNYSETA